MVEDKHYETNIALYDYEEEDEWNGNFGEHDFAMHGDEAVVQSHLKLTSFKYEVKSRAGRASRTPWRGKRIPRGETKPVSEKVMMEGLVQKAQQ